MHKLLTKIWKPLVASAAGLLLLAPGLAAAANTSYSWQSPSRQAIVATDGSTKTTFDGTASPGDKIFAATTATKCDDGTTAKPNIAVSGSNYQANENPTVGTVTGDCGGNTNSIKIYKTAAEASTQAASDASPSCTGGVLSYILCPVYNWILTSINTIEKNVIIPFLQITPISMQTNSPTYLIWQQFRNLANIGFIIAFLVIIFASTLSIQLDSYSLKKMLPRLVMAAILVQFSYLLVALAVDVTNIIGVGLQSLILAPLSGQTSVVINNAAGTLTIAAGITALVAAAGGIISGTILVVLIGAFFAIIGVFLTLVARQILVTLLLLLGPLAFVAWILPNTEHLFKIWRTTLLRLLMMYPMIVMLFASGKLFGAAAASSTGGGFGNATIRSLIEIVAGLIPLFLIPFTFKYAGAALVTIGGWMSKATSGAHGGLQATSGYDRFKTRTQQRKVELAAGQKVAGFGAITGNRAAAQLGRGVKVPLTKSQARTQNVRAMVAFNNDANTWKKRLDEENMTYEGVSYLSLGNAWYNKEHGDIQTKINAARAAGNTNELAVQNEAMDRLTRGKQEGDRYFDNSAARAAAALKRAEMKVASDDDRAQLLDYTKPTEAGAFVARQMWGRVKEGARDTNVHLAYTDVKGNLDVTELRKFVARKTQGAWTEYSVDAIKTMDSNNILADLASERSTRQTLINIMGSQGGPSIGAEQQDIIRAVLQRVPAPDPNHPDPADL